MERFDAALSHQRATSGPGSDRPPPASDLLPEPLSPDLVARLPQGVDPPSQLKQHPQLAHRRLRVPLDVADSIRVAEPCEPNSLQEHYVLRDRKVRAQARWKTAVFQGSRAAEAN